MPRSAHSVLPGAALALLPAACGGGGDTAPVSSGTRFPPLEPANAAIALERALSHMRYTMGLVRGSEPNSATSECFINPADSTFLDADATASNRGCSALGLVLAGAAVADAMAAAPCNLSPSDFGRHSPDCVPEPSLRIAGARQRR
ncbi:MAG: hypothetical protein C0505_17215 [Leptothrix sp. (in: Bacteria)]|nr:hypothetical protein [Leptothrix sp. (in: b-proteobacteria)]